MNRTVQINITFSSLATPEFNDVRVVSVGIMKMPNAIKL